MRLFHVLTLLPVILATTGPTLNPQYMDDNNHGQNVASSLPLGIPILYNNRGFAKFPGNANFDGFHSGYPAEYLPSPKLTYGGVNFSFPQYQPSGGSDNLLAQGQVLHPPQERYSSVHMFAAAETAVATKAYAEWYWWYMNEGPNTTVKTYQYNLGTYGENHVYDNFIQNFSTSAFDPKQWVDLFADAGANYFVQTTKHHDGYVLFYIPANISNRNRVAHFPHKNLLQMLFDAADTYQPHLRKGTYFSLPEWFHPDYKALGFGDWPRGNATNPYTNETLPYTGYVPVDGFFKDLILPELLILADMGTEIMWCDIGGPNLTTRFATDFYNAAAERGRQVTMNSRCGVPGDFDTPEYARYDAAQLRKWESNFGMDPYSYGYNRATLSSAYITPAEIVTSLVDIVSKNGNFLLDIGPTANGTVIEVEQNNLRTAGKWIHSHAEAIFNTTYWFVTPQEGEAVRFTQTLEAFYILTLYPPNATLVLGSPVPYVEGDKIEGLGGNMRGTVVPSTLLGSGSLELMVSEEVKNADEYSWVFKMPYRRIDKEDEKSQS